MRKIPTSYKYFKIVKIAVYVFKHPNKTLRVFGKHKAQKIKMEYLRYNNFPFLKSNFINAKYQNQPRSVLKYFPKILW